MKQTVEDDKVKDKISDEERKQICEACDEAIKWLDGNQMAEKDEFNHQKKELEKVCTPIITKMYQGSRPSRTTRSRTRSATRSASRSARPVTRPSSGWTATRWPRKTSSTTRRRSWRRCARPSSPRCTRAPAVECPAVCPTWVAPQPAVTPLALLLAVQPSKRSINPQIPLIDSTLTPHCSPQIKKSLFHRLEPRNVSSLISCLFYCPACTFFRTSIPSLNFRSVKYPSSCYVNRSFITCSRLSPVLFKQTYTIN